MALNGVNGKWFSEQMNTGHYSDPKMQEGAKEGFSKNLKGMSDQNTEESGGEQEVSDQKSYNRIDYYYGKTATELMLRLSLIIGITEPLK